MESVFARLYHCAFTLIEVCDVHPCTMLNNRRPWSLASWSFWILSSKILKYIIGRKLFDLTNMKGSLQSYASLMVEMDGINFLLFAKTTLVW